MKSGKEKKSMGQKTKARAKRRVLGSATTLILPDNITLLKADKDQQVIKMDILPYRVTVGNHPEVEKGDTWWERTYQSHRVEVPGGERARLIVCPKTVGKPCPICEEYERQNKDPKADEDVVKALRPREREVFNVRVAGSDEIQIMDISTFLFGNLLEKEINDSEDESVGNFAELEGGKTLRVRWSEESMGENSFYKADNIKFLEREDISEDVLESVVDLDRALVILSYDEIERLLAGADDSDDSDDNDDKDEDEKPKAKSKKKPAVEDDDDSDDDADDAEEDEDEKPKAKSKKKPVVEDDDEEDEKPKAKAKKPAVEDDDDDSDDNDDADEDDDACVACDGTGKTAKGNACPVCKGKKKLVEDDDSDDTDDNDADDSDDDEDEKPKKKAKKPAAEDDDDGDSDDKDEDEDEKPKRRRIIR